MAQTNEWVEALGGRGNITLVIDTTRELYGKWGLPLTGVAHTFGLTSLSQVVSLAWNEGIYNRATKGKCRIVALSLTIKTQLHARHTMAEQWILWHQGR